METLSARQAAKMAGVTYENVFYWLRLGYVQGSKIGSVWEINKESLEKFVAERKAKKEKIRQLKEGGKHE